MGVPTIIDGTLNLSNKNLTSLEGLEDIPNLNLVTELDLSCNQLESLSAAIFDNLTRLLELNLSNNQLQSLPANIFNNLIRLHSLNLSGNPLQSLPADIFDNLTRFTRTCLFQVTNCKGQRNSAERPI